MNTHEIEQHFSGVYGHIVHALFSQEEKETRPEDQMDLKSLVQKEFTSMRQDMKEALEYSIDHQRLPMKKESIEDVLATIQKCRDARFDAAPWPQHLLSITDQQMLDIYKLANELWQDSASQEEARKILLLLWNLNPAVGAFWHTYAFAIEKMGQYRTAAFCYLTSLNCNTDYPDPFIPLARCLSKIGRNDLGEELLDHVIILAEREPAFSTLKEPIKRARASI